MLAVRQCPGSRLVLDCTRGTTHLTCPSCGASLKVSPSLTDGPGLGYIVPEWDARIHGTIWRARLPGHSEVRET